MNTNTEQTGYDDVIPDKKNIPLMADTAWILLAVSLGPSTIYDKPTEKMAKAFIRAFMSADKDPYKAYAEFCQRILMARRFIDQNPDYDFNSTIPHWLDPRNHHGFAGTAGWFEKLAEKRKADPIYLLELKAFPEALLELSEEPASANFHYWADWFLERGAHDQYLLIQLVGAQLVFRHWDDKG